MKMSAILACNFIFSVVYLYVCSESFSGNLEKRGRLYEDIPILLTFLIKSSAFLLVN